VREWRVIGPAYDSDGWYALPDNDPWLAGHFTDTEQDARLFVDQMIDRDPDANRWHPDYSTLTMTAERLATVTPAMRDQYVREFDRATGRTMMRANPDHVAAVRRMLTDTAAA
jgi:hypothetical protein